MHIPAKIKNKRQRSLYSAFYTALKLCVCARVCVSKEGSWGNAGTEV